MFFSLRKSKSSVRTGGSCQSPLLKNYRFKENNTRNLPNLLTAMILGNDGTLRGLSINILSAIEELITFIVTTGQNIDIHKSLMIN